MMTQLSNHFLLIDDDQLNNYLSKRVLKKTLGEVHINEFTIPEEGLEFIQGKSIHHHSKSKTTIFLDLNMPSISGWEFLKIFESFEQSIKEHYNIFILSSSVNLSDITQAKENPYVLDFLEKPLSKEKITEIFK